MVYVRLVCHLLQHSWSGNWKLGCFTGRKGENLCRALLTRDFHFRIQENLSHSFLTSFAGFQTPAHISELVSSSELLHRYTCFQPLIWRDSPTPFAHIQPLTLVYHLCTHSQSPFHVSKHYSSFPSIYTRLDVFTNSNYFLSQALVICLDTLYNHSIHSQTLGRLDLFPTLYNHSQALQLVLTCPNYCQPFSSPITFEPYNTFWRVFKHCWPSLRGYHVPLTTVNCFLAQPLFLKSLSTVTVSNYFWSILITFSSFSHISMPLPPLRTFANPIMRSNLLLTTPHPHHTFFTHFHPHVLSNVSCTCYTLFACIFDFLHLPAALG